METLINSALSSGMQGKALALHLRAIGVTSWKALNASALWKFRDELARTVAPSTVKTYCASLAALIERNADKLKLPADWRKALQVRGELPIKTYLTTSELAQLRVVTTSTRKQAYVKAVFIAAAMTGQRLSDITTTPPEAIQCGMLSYNSIKTGQTATVPVSASTEALIHKAAEFDGTITVKGFNEIIRELCRKAGINTRVRVFKAGKALTGEKWQFVSSHTARISFCTNLARMGVPILDISRMAGHSSISMTERYIVPTAPRLNEQAMRYLGN